ncbi:hypothetical protein EDB19DRAFT_1833618 [Suillus lakei]|nr:hypothetical protein EDB19DRAFT_1833618 [Suillus lakei]
MPPLTLWLFAQVVPAKAHEEQNGYVLLVQSDLLFPDIPNEQQGTTAIPWVSCKDIGMYQLMSHAKESNVPLSPRLQVHISAIYLPATFAELLSGKASKIAQKDSTGSNAKQGSDQPDFMRTLDLYDPNHCYAGLGSLCNTKVECPDVCDGQGAIIHPRDYWTKLRHAKFVEVEVYLELLSQLETQKIGVPAGGNARLHSLLHTASTSFSLIS